MKIQSYDKNEFKNEHKRLMSLIPSGLQEALRAHRAIVAGGAITSLFTNAEVNDLDIYFRSWSDLESFLAHMADDDLMRGNHTLNKDTNGWTGEKRLLRHYCKEDGNADLEYPTLDEEKAETVHGLRNIGMTGKSVMYAFGGECILQVIAFDVFPEGANAIFNKFDWTINMGSFDFYEELWHMPVEFLKHNSQKMLILNTQTDHPVISLLRVGKYVSRGYKIAKKEMLKLGIAISQLNLESWDDCKKQLSGMYGTDVDKLFSDTEDFSISALFDKLDSAENDYINSIATHTEKRTDSYEYNEVTLIEILQKLRMNTGRYFISKLWAVCSGKKFYFMDRKKHSQVLHIGSSSDEEYPFFNGFSDAAPTYYKKANADGYASYVKDKERGAIILTASIGDPSLLNVNCDRIIPLKGANVKLEDIVEIIGELDEYD